MLRCRPPHGILARKDPFCLWRVGGVTKREAILTSEVSIPDAHPLFREETPGTRERVDFIGF